MLQQNADFRSPLCVQPVRFGDSTSSEEMEKHLEQFGFVVVEMAGPDEPETKLATLAASLRLGEPYIPTLYRYKETKNYSSSFSNIRSNAQDHHPGFSSTGGQDWHVDGLLDEIGSIKTTILHCVLPADHGGETLLFNSIAVFAQLQIVDSAAAEALLSPDALTRRSTIPGVDLHATGPAFGIDNDGNYLTRYTDNDTCSWNLSADPASSLSRALAVLRAAAEDPKYSRGVRLETDQALVFRNDRLSHGRQAYRDTQNARRHLIRALYANAPFFRR